DTGLAIVRRFLRGQPIFGADRRHIHHVLLDRGLTPRGVVLLMYGVAGVAAAASLLVSVSDNQTGGLIILLFCVGVWFGVQYLGYGEFAAARRILFGGVIGRSIEAHLSLRQLDQRLRSAATADECWRVLISAGRSFGFNAARLAIGGRTWRERLGPDCECWQLQVPLNGTGMVEFAVPFDAKLHPVLLAPFARIVHDDLLASLAPLARRVAEDEPLDPCHRPPIPSRHGCR
ncbi:MAG TPA: hypothetical protein VGF59_10530, partial [Bryobacteraceae bacterium]